MIVTTEKLEAGSNVELLEEVSRLRAELACVAAALRVAACAEHRLRAALELVVKRLSPVSDYEHGEECPNQGHENVDDCLQCDHGMRCPKCDCSIGLTEDALAAARAALGAP